jgi:hypothetical protein
MIQGTAWRRSKGQVLEWSWQPGDRDLTIQEVAIDFSLLVKAPAAESPAPSAMAPIAVLGLEGTVVELGSVHLVNTFLPTVTTAQPGSGYLATGACRLDDPSLVKRGYVVRSSSSVSTPPDVSGAQSLITQVGDTDSSAMLAHTVVPFTAVVPAAIGASIYDILSDPQSYRGKQGAIEAHDYGWSEGLSACPPHSPDEWRIGSDQLLLYVRGALPHGIALSTAFPIESPILVVTTVATSSTLDGRLCPYGMVDTVELRNP